MDIDLTRLWFRLYFGLPYQSEFCFVVFCGVVRAFQ